MTGSISPFLDIVGVYDSATEQATSYFGAIADWLRSLGATDGDDQVYIQQTIVGTCGVRWVDSGGVQQPYQTGFSLTVSDGFVATMGGVSYTYEPYETSGAVSPASMSYNASSRTYGFSAASTRSERITVQGDTPFSVLTSSITFLPVTSPSDFIQWRYNQTSARSQVAYLSVNFSTLPTDGTAYFHLPIAGQTVTYDGLAPVILNIINEDHPDEDPLTEEDVPSFDDALPTEPTEPTEPPTGGGGFVFDYNEVISPLELVDILSDETYDLEAVDDRGLLTAEPLPQLPDATFSADGLSLIADTVTVGKSMLESLGLWVPFVATAVVVVLIRVLK